jgi:CDP-paratose 2-epimerase
MSTNKVYGDGPNRLPLLPTPSRFVLPAGHPFSEHGIDESMSIDQCRHSLFGVSKAAADLMVQEYASRFGLATLVFRAGCITGPEHRAVPDHGFLAYLCRQVTMGLPYTVIGHGGLQVRDNLHVDDLAEAFARAIVAPAGSGVYNIGGGPGATISVSEALELAGRLSGRAPIVRSVEEPRHGDHMWWVTDFRRFQAAYPAWRPSRDTEALVASVIDGQRSRLSG